MCVSITAQRRLSSGQQGHLKVPRRRNPGSQGGGHPSAISENLWRPFRTELLGSLYSYVRITGCRTCTYIQNFALPVHVTLRATHEKRKLLRKRSAGSLSPANGRKLLPTVPETRPNWANIRHSPYLILPGGYATNCRLAIWIHDRSRPPCPPHPGSNDRY